MIISIGGAIGSGKSTIAKMLAKKLKMRRYSMGDIFRKKAEGMKTTVGHINIKAETNPLIDKQVDLYQKKLGNKENNFIIEGRTSWFMIPHSLKIFIDVDEREAARRIFKQIKKGDKRNENVTVLKSLTEVLKSQRKRKNSEIKRYKKYYNINIFNLKNYDYVINTTNLSKKQVFNKIYKFVKQRLSLIDKTEKLL